LEVECEVDDNIYATGENVSKDEFAQINIEKVGQNESWNYIIRGFKNVYNFRTVPTVVIRDT